MPRCLLAHPQLGFRGQRGHTASGVSISIPGLELTVEPLLWNTPNPCHVCICLMMIWGLSTSNCAPPKEQSLIPSIQDGSAQLSVTFQDMTFPYPISSAKLRDTEIRDENHGTASCQNNPPTPNSPLLLLLPTPTPDSCHACGLSYSQAQPHRSQEHQAPWPSLPLPWPAPPQCLSPPLSLPGWLTVSLFLHHSLTQQMQRKVSGTRHGTGPEGQLGTGTCTAAMLSA